MFGKKWTSFLFFILIFGMVFTGCTKKTAPIDPPDATVPNVKTPEDTPAIAGGISPLTGLSVENTEGLKLRPIAVMIDNEVSARPQSGLMNADIVYEIPVEGNITRYMAIYLDEFSEKIGPVRSARPYFLDKSMEFGAVYVHCGGSPQALKDIVNLNIDALNDLKGSPCFWRAKDRKMPHNLYASTELMRKVTLKNNLETSTAPTYFQFSDIFLDLDGKKVDNISIKYYNGYFVGYEYNESEKLYYRSVNGKQLKDKETEDQIKAVNIIIERLNTKVLDSAGRLEITNIGKDRGYLLTGGKLIEIEWQKDSRSAKTIYKDLQGNEIKLNKGNTWINVVPYVSKIEIGGQ